MTVGVHCSPAQTALNCPLEREEKTQDGKSSFEFFLIFHVHS